jgi:hypothetical protein
MDITPQNSGFSQVIYRNEETIWAAHQITQCNHLIGLSIPLDRNPGGNPSKISVKYFVSLFPLIKIYVIIRDIPQKFDYAQRGKEKVMGENTALTPNMKYSHLAEDEQINLTVTALESNNIHTIIASDRIEAKRTFFELIPEGAEIFLGASRTLEILGIKEEIENSGRYDALRPRMLAMNRETQGREIRKLGPAPDYAAGSVQALTEDGHVLIASNTGSQLGPYAMGGGNVIWVVGAQKIVKDINAGMRRIEEYCRPLEAEHMQQLYHMGTSVNKILIVNREFRTGRITTIIVKEELGY